jgi:hypothetical protein
MPQIVAIGTSIPELVATNDYVVSLVLDHRPPYVDRLRLPRRRQR